MIEVRFPARHRIFEEGGYADRFRLIQSGRVALDLEVPGEGPVVVEIIRRVAGVMARRLAAARTRLLAVSSRARWT